MRIVMVASVAKRCGVAEYTRDLVMALRKHVEVSVLPNPDLLNRQESARTLAGIHKTADLVHIQYHPDHFGSWRYPRRAKAFASFVSRLRVPVVMTIHDIYAPPKSGRVTSPRSLVRFLIHALVNTPAGRKLRAGFLDLAQHVIVHSETMKKSAEEYGVPTHRISLLYPGVPELFGTATISIRDKLRIEKDVGIVTVFGFVRENKGIECVIDAVARLPDAVLLIAGGAPDRVSQEYLDALLATCKDRGIDDRVRVTGYLESQEVAAALTGSDVIVLPYPRDLTSASYALSYAAASGRPIVVSDTPYFRERKRRYDAFEVFPPGDSISLASLLREILQTGRELPGANALRTEDSWSKVAARTATLYRQVFANLRDKTPGLKPDHSHK